MPVKVKRETRTSAKAEDVKEEVDESKPSKQNLVELDPQRVFYLPDEVAASLSSSAGVSFARHPHPRTKTAVLFVVCGHKLFELTTHSTREGFCSFLIDQTVEKDGKIYTVTPFDARFLVLETLRETAKFVELSSTIEANLSSALENVDLEVIADVKDVCDRHLVRYNEEKVIAWLEGKVRRIANVLASKGIACGAVARSKILQQEQTANAEDYLSAAAGIIREYISDALAAQLERHLGIERKKPLQDNANELESSTEESKPKRRRTEEPTEDYSKSVASASDEKKPTAKLTPAQKKLAQCDKTGMKSIASFFGKKK